MRKPASGRVREAAESVLYYLLNQLVRKICTEILASIEIIIIYSYAFI